MRKRVLLLGTLGGSWSIIPELLGFTNYEDIKLFAGRNDLAERALQLAFVEEVWLVTTNGALANKAVSQIRRWQELMGKKSPVIRIWSSIGVNDLTTQSEIRSMQELTWRLALKATETRCFSDVCYCLAGGRKTMSSDLQQAASLFGGHQLLHLIDSGNLPDQLRGNRDGSMPLPETFTTVLAWEDAELFEPVIVDRDLPRAELLDFPGEMDGLAITSERFDVPMAPVNGAQFNVSFPPELCETIENRRTRARHMLFHYAQSLTESSNSMPFQALYVLPPALLQKLKDDHIGVSAENAEDEIAWLDSLPKTDLHCHLGGIADCAELIEMAISMQEDLATHEVSLQRHIRDWRHAILSDSEANIRSKIIRDGEKRLKETFIRLAAETNTPPWAVCGWFISLFQGKGDLLERFVFGKYLNPNEYIGVGIDSYEKLGDLQGSCLLQTESAIRAACRSLLKKCARRNVRYIEVRCSPVNYTRGGLTEQRVVKFIQDELAKGLPITHTSLIFIGSRHGTMSDCWRHVELAQGVLEENNISVPLIGFDLAGNENFDADRFVPAFKPLFEKCLHITVHAGEGEPAEKIWKAVYALNAERIGHGLTLGEHEKLLMHFLDRGIAIEMCPSSNCQIVGFKDSSIKDSECFGLYPLKSYLEKGLKVSVNTDNPGISRTNATFELYRAARLTEGGLSRWDILQLIKNGFSSSFANHEVRRRLLLDAEKQILQTLQETIF